MYKATGDFHIRMEEELTDDEMEEVRERASEQDVTPEEFIGEMLEDLFLNEISDEVDAEIESEIAYEQIPE